MIPAAGNMATRLPRLHAYEDSGRGQHGYTDSRLHFKKMFWSNKGERGGARQSDGLCQNDVFPIFFGKEMSEMLALFLHFPCLWLC